jgi:hypothetical protein
MAKEEGKQTPTAYLYIEDNYQPPRYSVDFCTYSPSDLLYTKKTLSNRDNAIDMSDPWAAIDKAIRQVVSEHKPPIQHAVVETGASWLWALSLSEMLKKYGVKHVEIVQTNFNDQLAASKAHQTVGIYWIKKKFGLK